MVGYKQNIIKKYQCWSDTIYFVRCPNIDIFLHNYFDFSVLKFAIIFFSVLTNFLA